MATTFLNGVLFTGPGAPDSPVIVTTADVADTIISTGTLTGSVFSTSYNDDDIFYAGNVTNALFDGGAQDDELDLFGLGGNIPVTFTNITVDGSGGSDYLDFGTAAVIGGLDTKVNIVNSLIRGGGGDSLGGADGDDDLYFGEDTTITGTKINGNVGADDIAIYGPALTTSIVAGGQDNDTIDIYSDVVGSLINGNQGSDYIDIYGPVTAASSVFGGQGGDSIYVGGSFTASTLSGDKGDDDIYFADAVSASSIQGADGNDSIDFGKDGKVTASVIQGGIGEDYLYFDGSEIKNTLITGNADNDTIEIGDCSLATLISSTVNGGEGDDDIFVEQSQGSIINGDLGGDYILIGNIIAGDIVTSVFGGDGSDDIIAESATTGAYFSGDAGNDFIDGTGQNDTIIGGTGNDEIYGNDGGDKLTGGTGNDLFAYLDHGDSYVTGTATALGSKIDTITDFNANEVDRFGLAYTQDTILSLSAGFTIDWQTTVNVALASAGGGPVTWGSKDVGVLVVSGQNAGTYLLYEGDSTISTSAWDAGTDGIVALSSLTGTITSANFVQATV